MSHRRKALVVRLLDAIERRVWERQDASMRAAGWEVARLGRWRRRYRHPQRFAAARYAAVARHQQDHLDAARRRTDLRERAS